MLAPNNDSVCHERRRVGKVSTDMSSDLAWDFIVFGSMVQLGSRTKLHRLKVTWGWLPAFLLRER